jgi:membrane protein
VLAEPRGGLVSLGVALALWSASAGFLGVMECMNVAYGVTDRRPWWRTRLEGLGLTIALSFFVILAFVLTLFAGPLARFVAGYLGPAGGVATIVINWGLSLSLMTLVTATLYYVAPDVDDLEFEWLSPGVVVFIAGFGVASAGFSMWVSRFASYDKTYGSLGAPIILLFWLYLLATFLLLGGELNALLDERRATGGDQT